MHSIKKTLSLAVVLISSLMLAGSVMATDSTDYETQVGNATVVIRGKGKHVCVAVDGFTQIPYIARGETQLEAETLAYQLSTLKSGVNGVHVESNGCDKSSTGSDELDADGKDGHFTLEMKGSNKFVCASKNDFSNVTILARAGTALEAEALARQACGKLGDSVNHCKESCQRIDGTSSWSKTKEAATSAPGKAIKSVNKGLKKIVPFY